MQFTVKINGNDISRQFKFVIVHVRSHILLPTMMPLALTKYFAHQNVSGTYFRKTCPFYINEQNIPTQKDESG